jgi:hypothetical protein
MMKRLQLTGRFARLLALSSLLVLGGEVFAEGAKNALGVFSPANYKTQYVYDDRVIAGDRLQQVLLKRKSEVDGCAAVLNGERGEYSSYYKVPSGFVAIEMILDQTGKVHNTRVAQDTLPDPKVADCIHRQVKDLRVDVSGLKNFQLKKYLVFEIKCKSEQNAVGDATVSTRCSGGSQLYDKFSVQ